MQTISKKGLTVKDLVTVGIFSALFLVFALVGGIFFAPNPVLTFYMPVGSALLCGPVYLLMLAKVQKRWAVTILGALLCIIWFVTSNHHQAVRVLGQGLTACQWTADGVAEAIVHETLPVLGVQYHPERQSFRRRRDDAADAAALFRWWAAQVKS